MAEVIQRVRADVLLVNEFDPLQNGDVGVSPGPENLFRDNFLEVSQNGAAPIEFPYVFIAPSNTGVATGKDLNNNGVAVTTPGAPGYGDDAFGFGAFPGQFGMVVYSKYPILYDEVRTFRLFKWKDMPGNLIPTPFYSPDEVEILRLSSKSHWDIPISIGGKTVHFLVSHPTPPVFDGPEDRNGRRNFDEIRFWADYITPGKSGYIYDDDGMHGGLKPGELFVIAGDQNSDPLDGDSIPGAIQQLIEHPLVNTKLTPQARARSRRRPFRVAPTRRTAATRSSTPPTSPTRRRGTCTPTTCCPARRSNSSTPASSGRCVRIRCSGSRASSTLRSGAWSAASRPPTTAASGSTSPSQPQSDLTQGRAATVPPCTGLSSIERLQRPSPARHRC